MSRILFCWEAGANFGHLAVMAALQHKLRDRGHELAFAVADLRAASALLGDGATIFQAPVWPGYVARGSRNELASFADVLGPLGFGDTATLSPMVGSWLALMRATGAQIAVSDHSPAAQLAARLAGLPLVTIGTGFTQPPLEYETLPPLRGDIAAAYTEVGLLRSAHDVMAQRGATLLPKSLPELLRPNTRIVIGLPELDPYRSFRREPLFAPPGGFGSPAEARYDTPPLVFAYLGTELPGLEAKVQVLCDLPFPVELHIRGGDRLLAEFIRMRGKVAYERPADMRDILARATHVISQGGAMLSSEVLAAGLPHLLLPTHRETEINASLVGRSGTGQFVDASVAAPAFKTVLTDFVADAALKSRALDLGRMLANRPLTDAGEAIVAALA
jgi:UDP:flavonoid glycosyltransferase YjiC (YdhE family)